jgi:hypothetical protein
VLLFIWEGPADKDKDSAGTDSAGPGFVACEAPCGLSVCPQPLCWTVLHFVLQGFESHWYSSNRVLQVYDGSKSADPQALLRQVPEQPGLHLWLVKPPCSRCAYNTVQYSDWGQVPTLALASEQQTRSQYSTVRQGL